MSADRRRPAPYCVRAQHERLAQVTLFRACPTCGADFDAIRRQLERAAADLQREVNEFFSTHVLVIHVKEL